MLPIFSFAQVNVNGVTKSNSEKIYFSHITFEDVNGNKFSTISNENAEYKINLKSGVYQIKASYVGYTTYTNQINLTSDTTFDIVFADDAKQLSEVVVKAVGQKVTEADLDAEQMHQESVSSGIINDFHGSGIVRESLFESNILLDTKNPGKYSPVGTINLSKEVIDTGNFDGRPIYLDLQPSDSDYGNRLELDLSGASIGGRLKTKVLVLGFAYSSLSPRGILVSEVISFEKNQCIGNLPNTKDQ